MSRRARANNPKQVLNALVVGPGCSGNTLSDMYSRAAHMSRVAGNPVSAWLPGRSSSASLTTEAADQPFRRRTLLGRHRL